MTGSLVGRKVLIIGGGTRDIGDPVAPHGNGRAVAIAAAREGAAVAVTDIDDRAAQMTAELLRRSLTLGTIRVLAEGGSQTEAAQQLVLDRIGVGKPITLGTAKNILSIAVKGTARKFASERAEALAAIFS